VDSVRYLPYLQLRTMMLVFGFLSRWFARCFQDVPRLRLLSTARGLAIRSG
jgi:hypothetical protein